MVITLSFEGLAGQTPPSHGEGVGLVEGGAVLLLTASEWVGPVMENVEGLVEGGGHGHHPLLLRTRRANLLFSSR